LLLIKDYELKVYVMWRKSMNYNGIKMSIISFDDLKIKKYLIIAFPEKERTSKLKVSFSACAG